jgi:hypothetical protein
MEKRRRFVVIPGNAGQNAALALFPVSLDSAPYSRPACFRRLAITLFAAGR